MPDPIVGNAASVIGAPPPGTYNGGQGGNYGQAQYHYANDWSRDLGGVNADTPGSVGYVGPQFGQTPGGAQATAQDLSNAAQSFQNIKGPVVGGPMGQEAYARQAQQQGIAAAMAGAQGNAPSASSIGQSAGISGDASGAFAAQRAGGGFGGAQAQSALAARGAQHVAAGSQGRAGETQSYMGHVLGGMNQLANQDVAQTRMDQGQAILQAQLSQQQGQVNNQESLAYQNMAGQTEAAQLQADSQMYNAKNGAAGALRVQDINNQGQVTSNILGAGLGAASGGIGSAMSQYYGQAGQNNSYDPHDPGY